VTHWQKIDPKRIPLSKAEDITTKILEKLSPAIIRGSVVGSVRRKEETIGDLDFVIEIKKSEQLKVKRIVRTFSEIYTDGNKKLRLSKIFGDPDVQGDIWMVYPPRNYYVMLALFTGVGHSQLFREKLISKGIPRPHGELKVQSEKEFFDLAGIPWSLPQERRAGP
jgi:DNA polymerase/3'-5' exonuclease PolX